MRSNGVRRMAFSSTGSIYGEAPVVPTPEDAPFPVQTSLYGASKLAGEGLIQAYCEGFGFQAWIFRFVSILGERYTHGHVFDFSKSLSADPSCLRVLGDGRQRKSYLYVQDCLDAILLAMERATGKINVFNLGTDEFCVLNESIGWITGRLGVSPAAGLHRRRPRLDRRQSVHLPRHRTHSRARLDSQALDPRSRPADGRLPAGAIRKCSRRALERRGARTLAPGIGYGRLHGCGRPLGDGIRSRTRRPSRRWRPGGRPSPNRTSRADRRAGCRRGRCSSPSISRARFATREVVWVTFDTPVDEDDSRMSSYVERQVEAMFPDLADRLPSCSARRNCPSERSEARAGVATVAAGRHGLVRLLAREPPARQGNRGVHEPGSRCRRRARRARPRDASRRCLRRSRDRIEWMSVESAEMTKHARERIPCDVGHLHQRAGGDLRAGRRRCQGGRAWTQHRAPHRAPRLLVPGRRICWRDAGAGCRVSSRRSERARTTHAADGWRRRQQRRAQVVGPAAARVGPRRPCRSEDRGLGPHVQARHGHDSAIDAD